MGNCKSRQPLSSLTLGGGKQAGISPIIYLGDEDSNLGCIDGAGGLLLVSGAQPSRHSEKRTWCDRREALPVLKLADAPGFR